MMEKINKELTSINKELVIPFGKSLTSIKFEKILNNYYETSKLNNNITFDLKQVEWFSLLELLLLVQWICHLSYQGKNIDIQYPVEHYLHGLDGFEIGSSSDQPIQEPMLRRKRALNFLYRMKVLSEVDKIAKMNKTYNFEKHDDDSFDDFSDPYDATILPVTSFWNKKELDIDKQLSNEKLLKLLKEHSCLDSIDSGILANVVIEELTSNAVDHAIKKFKKNCAWVAARLVKSSKSTINELPKWYEPAFQSLMGKHYIELSICDNGPGIFEQLKNYVPTWICKKGVSVKATIDYAFDKFSSSASEFRTDIDSMNRGLFYVYEIVRQYRGVLTVRSGGYYMVYDFLSRDKHPRLLGLFNNGGQCLDIEGTAIQIILPQSEGFYLSTSYSGVKSNYKTPIIVEVSLEKSNGKEIDDYAKEIAKEIEILCQGSYEIPIIVDITELNFKDNFAYYLFLNLMKYIIWIANPNLIWILAPNERHVFEQLNNYLLSKKVDSSGIKDPFGEIFQGLNNIDLNIIPVLFPNTEIFWMGADEQISQLLNNIWGAGTIELSEFGDKSRLLHKNAILNPHLIDIKKNIHGKEPVFSLAIGNYEIANSLPILLKETCAHLLHTTFRVINHSGCYHLPHGAYSKKYFYLKPLLIRQNYVRKLSIYISYLLSLHFQTKNLEVDIIVGGTHSVKRLLNQLGVENNCHVLTIDRYVGQIDEAIVGEKVANKNILVVSDVISSGTFVKQIVTRLKSENANIKAIACICDIRPQDNPSNFLYDIPVISLYTQPVERYDIPIAKPIYEVNPISLRPSLPENEISRNHIPSLVSHEKLTDWIIRSESLVPAHLVLGPTHYTYFFDTKKLLEKFGEDIFKIILDDVISSLSEFSAKTNQILTIENNLSAVITAEDSNAEFFFPEIVKKRFPEVTWIQVERIRLNQEGTWQLDRLDPELDHLDKITDHLVLILDDGSNTGGTLTQLIEIVSEYEPKLILAYCVVNRLSANRSRFFSRLSKITGGSRTIVKFLSNVPVTTFVYSNCPICNRHIPKMPPLDEFIKFNTYLNEIHQIQKWNHLTADTINEKSRKIFYNRGFPDVHYALSDIYIIRSLLGYFENYVNIPKDLREKLLSLPHQNKNIPLLCYILNREPQLLYSVINFQIRDFEFHLLNAIIEMINNSEVFNNIFGRIDILEYLAKNHPDYSCEHIDLLLKSLIIDTDSCIIFLYFLFYEEDPTKVLERLYLILKKTTILLSVYKETTAYLRGLINSCISWLNIERIRICSDNLRQAINDLQSFYREGRPHCEAADLGKPLNRILNFIHFYEKSNKVRDREHYNSIYRDWRDYTVRCIETRLIPSLYSIKSIIEVELSATMQSYYNIESDTGVKKEYLSLQKHLFNLREIDNQELYLKSNKNEIKRQIQRITEYMFSDTKSPINKIVKNIPVSIVKHIKQRINNNLPWIKLCGIDLIEGINISEISGFMTVRVFKQILDKIFLNIKIHNFGLDDNIVEKSKILENPKIMINLELENENIVIQIKSNGPNNYENRPGQGIRDNFKYCRIFDAQFSIYNNNNWVVNLIKIKRW